MSHDGTVDPKHRRHSAMGRGISSAGDRAAAMRCFATRLAGRLAGELGQRIADEVPGGNSHSWAWVLRTYLFDQFISQQIEQGADMVVNLAAGLDARPYRMTLPRSLQLGRSGSAGIDRLQGERHRRRKTGVCA